MFSVMRQRARLITIVSPRDREHRKRHLGVLARRRVVAVPVRVAMWMRKPFLKDRGREAKLRIEVRESGPGLEPTPELLPPIAFISPEQLVLGSTAPNQHQPLQQVGPRKQVTAGKIH